MPEITTIALNLGYIVMLVVGNIFNPSVEMYTS